MAAGNLKEFSQMFEPFDENYAMDLADKMLNRKQSDSNLDPSQMVLPPGLDPNLLEQIQNQHDALINQADPFQKQQLNQSMNQPPGAQQQLLDIENNRGNADQTKTDDISSKGKPWLKNLKAPGNSEGEDQSYKTSMTEEIEQLQRVLGKARVNINNKILFRAFMMPDDCLGGPGGKGGSSTGEGKSYPTPAYGLMPPFEIEEPKKAKKPKRRRRRPTITSIEESMDELL